jgi:hypothetical protein
MAFTNNCDIFGSVHEAGIGRVVRHIMRQRPSLFNYATPGIRERPEMLCERIDVHPVVIERGNPITGEVPYLPVAASGGYGLDYCVQVTTAEIDFSPGNVVSLPPELSPPLGDQRFAFHGAMCAGLACPPQGVVDELQPLVGRERERKGGLITGVEIPIPARELECFCLDLFMTGGVDFVGLAGDQHLLGRLEGLEFVDLEPKGMENSIECYLKLVIQLGVLPRLRVPTVRFVKELMGLTTITIEPTPAPPTVPNNPALEEDQLKIFLDMTTGPPGPPSPPGPPGPPEPPPVPGVERPRIRTGPFDVTAAASDDAVGALFGAVRDAFTVSESDSGDFGPFSASYTVAAHLENGTIDMRDDNTIHIEELDVKWDTLELCLGIDIPGFCVGGFCIIPNPLGGCVLRAPEICVFEDDPDIEFCLDIGGFLTSEITATVAPLFKYAVDPARTPAMTDWDAKDAGIPNKWQLLIDPVTIDFDLIDFADTIGDLLDAALEAAIDGLLGFLPGWARDLILALLGPVIDVVRAILDLGDDIDEWLTDLLGVSFGLFDLILTLIADHFAADSPVLQIEDPVPVMPASGGLIPVLIPVEFLGVEVTADELILGADIGA